ncbi:MAG: hypothetical protein WA655_21945 [Candidatus Korobacteraceae bacterium]
MSASNINLVFVVSEDLAYNAAGDVNPTTANLTSQGLQRSLLMGSFLQTQVLGSQNVTAIYALEPMTHLQTINDYPDMVGLTTMQQFAALNRVTMSGPGYTPYPDYSFPINVSYGSYVPDGVAAPLLACESCQGLDFTDHNGANEALVSGLIHTNAAGFYVFSAPWETVSSLLTKINDQEGLDLSVPATYAGPNYVYAISIAPSGSATLVIYNSNLNPASTYPALPSGGIVSAACVKPTFHVQVTGGSGGAVVPAGTNVNETVYFVRHAEAHPVSYFEDGNFVAAGQWRALDIPNALRGKIQPTQVYSIDPAQALTGAWDPAGVNTWSYVRTNLTVLPYAIANNLPYKLAASFEMMAQSPPQLATVASDFFFTGGTFSNESLLVGWEHDHIPTTVNALLTSYHSGQTVGDWASSDYDTVWTVKLDANGNLSVDNATCEGISSPDLPKQAPQF